MGMMRPVLRRGGRVAEGAPLLRSTPQKGVGVRIPFSAILRSRVFDSCVSLLSDGKRHGKVLDHHCLLPIMRTLSALIAQLDRVLGYEPSGRRFESS